jgi:hypothetical protein
MPGARRAPKQCGLYLERAKAEKKDLAHLGKGLAYNAGVVPGAGGVPRLDDPEAAASGCWTPLKLLPFGGMLRFAEHVSL